MRPRRIERNISLNGTRLSYNIELADVKSLSISVHPDLNVWVKAPVGAGPEELDRRVRRRAPWIFRQLRDFEQLHPLPVPRKYISGETHLYLGNQYRLRVRKGAQGIELARPFMVVAIKGRRTRSAVEHLMSAWYVDRAHEIFRERLDEVMRRSPWLRKSRPHLRIRTMTRRWGSCSPSGLITLNTELIKAPKSCIDYIIIHELCHGKEMSHSKKFYGLLARAAPDWERSRDKLNRFVR